MIEAYAGSQEVATIFLRALLDKNVVVIARSNGTTHPLFLTAHLQLIGLMAEKFQNTMINLSKEREPSPAKTVKKVIACVKEMFFPETNEKVRAEIGNCFEAMLEFCFAGKRYGVQQKKAKDLIFGPLFEEL